MPAGPSVFAHWMISSARARSECGIVSPRAFAVLALMASSNLVGCSTGRVAGFAPRRILSTYAAGPGPGESTALRTAFSAGCARTASGAKTRQAMRTTASPNCSMGTSVSVGGASLADLRGHSFKVIVGCLRVLPACGLEHRTIPFGLVAARSRLPTRPFPDCRADLTDSLRGHLYACA